LFMKQRIFTISDSLHVIPLELRSSHADWGTKVMWVDIENPTPEALEELLKQNGVEKWLIDRILARDFRHEIYDTEHAVFFNFPIPIAWLNNEHSTIRMILVAGAVITVRNFTFEGMEEWLNPRNIGRKVVNNTVPGLLIWLFIALLSGDAQVFYQLRDKAEDADQQMRVEGCKFDHRILEDLTASTNRLLVTMYDAQALLESLQLAESAIFTFESHNAAVQKCVENLRILREGLEALQRRLENIKQQHSINLQRQTDHRIRVLTIFSAVIMPPTLITGIYGMNLPNIPGINTANSYLVVFALIFGVSLGMLALFYKRGWFQ
jgi:magnesium transporter